MLEKIGLPPKPSLRGNNWVVDASHCQGCSSQFTFINRKHHCRRCGGIFCSSCTQQRMVLRGQGDSPVRICEPCKQLEEAARFEMRYGHKSRSAKGASKLASKKDDEIIKQFLGNEEKLLSIEKTSASCSNIPEVATQIEGGDIVRNLSLDQPDMLAEVGSATPEDLRQQAVIEKKKYRTLKAEGKSEEALKAFKRGKELERQAGALEISLRKTRKKALSSGNLADSQQIKDEGKASADKHRLPTEKSKEKDGLSAELKELGWSDMDLRDAEKRPATLEGELSSLLREISQKPNKEKQTVSTDKSQIIVHKKKALELKRAGNLVEAKEELKRAKILERKIEEEELLGDADDSDDELSSLIRSMDADEHDDLPARHKSDLNMDFSHFIGIAEDLAVDGNFEVTDEDMDDPEIASALKSLGWTEDPAYSDNLDGQVEPSSKESLLTEIQSLKRAALNQKRAGNTEDAMALLRKAKLLERELANSDTHGSDLMNQDSAKLLNVSVSQSVEEPFFSTRASVNDGGPKLAPKNKLMIQKELIALKKKALALRREGRIDESEEELKKAKVLEEQLEEMNNAPSVTQPNISNRQTHSNLDATLGNEDDEEVTDRDMRDPTYLSLLKNLGWEDEDSVEVPSMTSKENNKGSIYMGDASITQSITNDEARTSRKSKSEIQRELLALKRKALMLRRQGDTEEADEVLKMARLLEAQSEESEKPNQREDSSENNKATASIDAVQNTKPSRQVDLHDSTERQVKDKVRLDKPDEIVHQNEKPYNHEVNSYKVRLDKPDEIVHQNEKPYNHEVNSSVETVSQPHSSSLQQEIQVHKRKAVALKREGKLAEAKEELRQAKLLEKHTEDMAQTTSNSSDASTSEVSSVDKEASPSSVSKPLSSRDRFKLQQESLGHKRKALKLRREGRTAEADAEFELAKALESQLQELDPSDSAGSSTNAEAVDDVSIEDFLDPQLLSALQSIGLEDSQAKPQPQGIKRPQPTKFSSEANIEREQLVEQIKAEKVKAVNLKRSGKQAEALDALRRAKLYEKKLQSLNSK